MKFNLRKVLAATVIFSFVLGASACGGSNSQFFRELCALLAMPDGTVFTMDEAGYLYTSTDNGETFTELLVPEATSGATSMTESEGTIVAGLKDGNFALSADLGYQWSRINGKLGVKWNDIDYSTDETENENYKAFLSVGTGGWIGKSFDLGLTWQYEKVADQDLNAIDCFKAMCYAVGNGGTLVGTWNGGSDWSSLDSDTDVDLRGVNIYSHMNVWAVGGAPATITYKIDDGVWEKHDVQINGDVTYLTDVYFKNPYRGIITGDGDGLFKTIDGGQSFEKVVLDANTRQGITRLKRIMGGRDIGVFEGSAFLSGSNGAVLRTDNLFDSYKDLSLRYTVDYGSDSGGGGSIVGGDDDDDTGFVGGDDDDDTGSVGGDDDDDTGTPGVLDITISNTEVRFDHSVGSTQCPQGLGSFTVTNSGTVVADISISAGSNVIATIKGGTTLAPGESLTVELVFLCSTSSSFSETINITATHGGQSTPGSVTVTGNVQ